MTEVLAGLVGYLLGSFPTADLVTKLATKGTLDLRAAGSGNPGATNAAAVLGKRWGIVVLLGDIAKGAIAGAIGLRIGGDIGGYLAATMSVAGHILPPWSRFRGGKGVATSAGACLAVFPWYFPADLAVAAIGAIAVRRAERATQISGFVWCTVSLVWWRAGFSNGWGPKPSWGLPACSVLSSAMILCKFAVARRQQVAIADPAV